MTARAREQLVARLHSAVQPEPVVPPVGEPAPTSGMTLAELEAMAQLPEPHVGSGRGPRASGARAGRSRRGLHPNPVVGYQGSEIGDEGHVGQQGGFVSQEVVTAGKLQLSRAAAGQAVRQAETRVQRPAVSRADRRGQAFYEVLVAQRSSELSAQLAGLGEQGVKAAEQLLKAKEVARVDVLQARIEADAAKILLEKAKNRHAAAWRRLAAVVGNPALQPVPLLGNLQDGIAPLGWDETLARLLAESPQSAAARAGVVRAQAVVNRENAGRVPNVELQAGVQYDNATGSSIAGVQLGVPLPIYNRNQGNIYKAQAELTAAQHEVVRL